MKNIINGLTCIRNVLIYNTEQSKKFNGECDIKGVLAYVAFKKITKTN